MLYVSVLLPVVGYKLVTHIKINDSVDTPTDRYVITDHIEIHI